MEKSDIHLLHYINIVSIDTDHLLSKGVLDFPHLVPRPIVVYEVYGHPLPSKPPSPTLQSMH